MRPTSLAGLTAALTGAIALAPAAGSAQTYLFGYSGSIVTWTAPSSGLYFIEAVGAQGGHGTISGTAWVGGRGALIGGVFSLGAGTTLQLAVGGQGTSFAGQYNGGGGGGSFVVDMFGQALLVAGGGGGIRAFACGNGSDASITAYAKVGSGSSCSSPGTTKTTGLGQGGSVSSSSYGGGGAGFFSNGSVDFVGSGKSWANGLAGGVGNYAAHCNSNGGFGGGGSGTGCGGGGGGGGYSGGDGGYVAGGGGSWNTGTEQVAVAGVGYGDGAITITTHFVEPEPVVTPEPVTMTLIGTGLAGVAAARRRKKAANQA